MSADDSTLAEDLREMLAHSALAGKAFRDGHDNLVRFHRDAAKRAGRGAAEGVDR